MYAVLNESMVTPGRATEAEAISQRLFELQAKQPGYQRGALIASIGYPGKYIRVTAWESPDAYRTFARSAALTQFLQANPTQGIITQTRPLEGFEVIAQRMDPGTSQVCVLVEGTVAPGKAAAFEQSRNELIALLRQAGTGVVASFFARSLANQNRYLIYHSFLSEEASQLALQKPEIQAWMQQHLGAYWAGGMDSAIERFQIAMVHAPVTV